MTPGEILAGLGFFFSVVGRIGLWYKKTWGWAVGTLGALSWLGWGLLIAFTKPGSGGWILLGNDVTFLVIGIVGWCIWSKEDKKGETHASSEAS